MIFHTNDFFIHFFRKYTFDRVPIDIAEKCSHIRIESIAFPLLFRKIFVARSPNSSSSFSTYLCRMVVAVTFEPVCATRLPSLR